MYGLRRRTTLWLYDINLVRHEHFLVKFVTGRTLFQQLDNHVSTEVVDDDMWQPIHAAACWGHLEVVEMLAQNGANISAKTKNGETPFDICEDPEIKVSLPYTNGGGK